MKRRSPFVMLSLVCAGLASAADGGTADVIRALEQTQAKAAIARDRPTLERVFAPDFRVINPAGAVADRDTLFGLLLGPAPAYASATYETQELRDLGDTVVTIGLETVVMSQGAQAGQPVRRRTTQVWHRQDGRWQLKLRQATLVQ